MKGLNNPRHLPFTIFLNLTLHFNVVSAYTKVSVPWSVPCLDSPGERLYLRQAIARQTLRYRQRQRSNYLPKLMERMKPGFINDR